MINLKKLEEIAKFEIENNEKIQSAILKEKWRELFSDKFENVSVNYIKNKILYLSVTNTTEKHYIHINKNNILKKINSEINLIFDDIKVI